MAQDNPILQFAEAHEMAHVHCEVKLQELPFLPLQYQVSLRYAWYFI
jgi:hypothetical protein